MYLLLLWNVNMINTFEEFIDKFLQWSIDVAEQPQSTGHELCIYAKTTRLKKAYHFIDARVDTIHQVETFDRTKDIGIAWVGDEIDLDHYIGILLELRERNPDLTVMLSTSTTGLVKRGFTCAFIVHNKNDFYKKQKHLYNIGYYSIYPEKFQKKMEDLYKNDNKSSE